MSSPTTGGAGADGEDLGPVIRDRRRLDPLTGQVRPTAAETPGRNPVTPDPDPSNPDPSGPGTSGPGTSGPGTSEPDPSDGGRPPVAGGQGAEDGAVEDGLVEDALVDGELAGAAAQLAAERLADLQRLHAEYVNYRRRVERDRDVARDQAVASVLEALLPVLDDVELARQHGDLAGGPFAAIAEKLEAVLGRFELTRYGTTGELFDPTVHEALMQSLSDEVEAPTVTTVLQPGYLLKEKVLRAARVGVTAPE